MKVFIQLMDAIAEASGGELIIDYLGGPEVIPGYELATAVQKGVVDIGMLPAGYYEGLVPISSVFSLSLITAAQEREVGFHDLIKKEHEKAGLFYLGRQDPKNDKMFVWMVRKGTKEIKTPYDMAGLTAGATGIWAKAFAEALGMAFVRIPTPEAYTAMERGVVDMFGFPLATHVSFGLHEVSSSIINHPFYVSNLTIILNLEKFNSLPAHLQKLIVDVYIDTEAEQIRLLREMLVAYDDKAKEAGIEYIQFSPSDAEWYINLAYRAERERLIKQFPDTAPMLIDMISN